MLDNKTNSYRDLTAIFRQWLRIQIGIWADIMPDVLMLFLLAVVDEHSRTGRAVEAELFVTLAELFPVPGVTVPKPLRKVASV